MMLYHHIEVEQNKKRLGIAKGYDEKAQPLHEIMLAVDERDEEAHLGINKINEIHISLIKAGESIRNAAIDWNNETNLEDDERSLARRKHKKD